MVYNYIYMNYTVSGSGDVTCPPNFIATDNTTINNTITNLTTINMTDDSSGSGNGNETMTNDINTSTTSMSNYDYVKHNCKYQFTK